MIRRFELSIFPWKIIFKSSNFQMESNHQINKNLRQFSLSSIKITQYEKVSSHFISRDAVSKDSKI